MTHIAFHLNGSRVCVTGEPATRTLLEWLRESRGLMGTKEGCNEGDCGACTVMVTDAKGSRALNSCLLFLPQLAGKAVRTVEGISAPDGTPHPVQTALIDHHASQCGFCTPGFAVSMATAHLNGRTDHDDQLAGNLCRCTGYAPIIRAAIAVEQAQKPTWLREDPSVFSAEKSSEVRGQTAPGVCRPETTDAFANWYLQNPTATLIAGATDVGLWVTKGLRDLEPVAFLNGIADLAQIEDFGETLRIGAGVTITDLLAEMHTRHPSFAELLRRYGSVQVRNAATIGGNIANGSPIGDGPPALIALGATLHLRRGTEQRDLPLEDFFLGYRKQDRHPAEFVAAVTIPARAPALRCYKVSKRFDQDISAVCGCFNLTIEDGTVTAARIGFGGMAATPRRATHVEHALLGRPWTHSAIAGATEAFDQDFSPLTDLRATADYRRCVARNLLTRYFHDLNGVPIDVLRVTA